MKIAAMQPYLFPYLGYFQVLAAVDKFILYDRLQYIKQGFMNRNRILAANAGPEFFTAPVQHASTRGLICDVRVADDTRWRNKLKKQLHVHYAHSPYFDQVYPRVIDVIETPSDRLAEINAASVLMVRNYLALGTQVAPDATAYIALEERLAALYESDDTDRRPALEKKVQRVVLLCQQEDARVFLNPIGGRALYDSALLKQHGVDVYFVQTGAVEYAQHNDRTFHPNLSILDVLFNCSPDQVRGLLSRFDLVQ